MDAAQSGYYGKFIRGKGVPVTGADKQRLLTDRSAYISFLEVQLERVTAAVLTAQGFSQRIDDQQQQVIDAHSKIVNLTKLIQLAQSYSEKIGQEASSQIAAVGHRASKVDTCCEALQHRSAAADSKLQQMAETQAKHSQGLASVNSSLDSLNGALSSRDGAMDALSQRLSDAVASLAPLSALRAVQLQAAEATKNTDAAVSTASSAENAAIVAREAAENASVRAQAAERASTAAAGSAAEAQERADGALEKAVKASAGLAELSPRVSGIAAVADRSLARCEDMAASLAAVRGHVEGVEGELRAGVRRCVLAADFTPLFQQAMREAGVPGELASLREAAAGGTDTVAGLAGALDEQRAAAAGAQAAMRSEIASLKSALAQRDERLAAIEERLGALGGGVTSAQEAAAAALKRASAAETHSTTAAEAAEQRLQAALEQVEAQAQRRAEEAAVATQGAIHAALQEAAADATPTGELETRCSALEGVVEELMHNSGVAPSASNSAMNSPRWQRPNARGARPLAEQVSALSRTDTSGRAQQGQGQLEAAVAALIEDVEQLQGKQEQLHGTQAAIMRRLSSAEDVAQANAASAAMMPPPRHPLHPGGSPSTSVAMSQSVSPVQSTASSVRQLHSGVSHGDWQQGQGHMPWGAAQHSAYATQASSDPVPGGSASGALQAQARDTAQRTDANSTALHEAQHRLAALEHGLGEMAEQLNSSASLAAGERQALRQELQGTQDSLRALADESVSRASNNAEIVLQALRTMEGRVSTRLEGVSPSAVRAVVQAESGGALQALRGSVESLRSSVQRVDAAGQDAQARLVGAEESLQALLRAKGEQGGTLSSAARGSIVHDISAQLRGELAASEARLARESADVLDAWQRGQRGELAGVVARTESLAAQVATSLSQLDRAMGMYHSLAAHVYGAAAQAGRAPPSRTVQATATPPRSPRGGTTATVTGGVTVLSTGTQRPPLSPPGALLRPRPPAAPVLKGPSMATHPPTPQDTPPGFTPTMRVPSTAGSAMSSRASSPGATPNAALPVRQRAGGKGKAVPPVPGGGKLAPRSKAVKGGPPRSTSARSVGARSAAERRASGSKRRPQG